MTDKPPFKAPFIEDSSKRVRALFSGKFIVDTYKSKLVWEQPYYPMYFFPVADMPSSSLRRSDDAHPEKGTNVYDLVVGNRVAKEAVIEFIDGCQYKDLAGLFKVNFASMDAWFEEDERVYAQPKDPYKRLDVLQTSRHVRVEINGVEVANTRRAKFLYETGMPRRTYIPVMDVKVALLAPSETVTVCQYKGWANFFDVYLPNGEVHKDVVWYYRTPNDEAIKVAGLLSFYDEKVTVWIDGERQD